MRNSEKILKQKKAAHSTAQSWDESDATRAAISRQWAARNLYEEAIRDLKSNDALLQEGVRTQVRWKEEEDKLRDILKKRREAHHSAANDTARARDKDWHSHVERAAQQIVTKDDLLAFIQENLPAGASASEVLSSFQKIQKLTQENAQLKGQVAEALEGCQVVFHLGALVDTRSGALHDQRILRTNVLGTVNVVQACETSSTIARLVFCSSAGAVITLGPKAGPHVSTYGRSKALGEAVVASANGTRNAAGVVLRTLSLRPIVVPMPSVG